MNSLTSSEERRNHCVYFMFGKRSLHAYKNDQIIAIQRLKCLLNVCDLFWGMESIILTHSPFGI